MSTPETYHFPAEWEPHAATWIGWPRHAADWPGKMQAIPWVFAEFVRWISRGEQVNILVDSPIHQGRASALLARVGLDPARLGWFEIPTNRNWTRDAGPMFARGANGTLTVLNFKFTAWARYRNWQKDDAMAASAGAQLGLPVVDPMYRDRRVVLEGGAIDVNGRGTILATEECLLDTAVQVRNPGFGRADMEAVFAQYLGARNTIWLGKGIAGDDTHGHVDDCCRFVNPAAVVLCACPDPADANHAAMAENRERLAGARLENGGRLTVIDLPMPEPLVFDGVRLPASYANFYIANHAVLVPTFNCPADREALGILAECFPDREVVGIHAVDLIWGLGAVHCLTQQQPVT